MTPATDLRQRLARLGAGARPAPASALDTLPVVIASRLSPSLAERLSRLRPRVRPVQTARRTDQQVAQQVGGALITPGLVRVDRTLSLPFRHGRSMLRGPLCIGDEHAARLGLSHPPSPGGFLLLDTETNGLGGGTGTIAFMIGLARLAEHKLHVTQFLLLAFNAEPDMLDAMARMTVATDHLVTYNGQSFDAPLLDTRFALHRKANPLAEHRHLDLLHWVRRHRPEDWPDARLATAESRWFGLERDNDIPGAMVPQAWRDWLTRRDSAGIDAVLHHNRLDLISLFAIFEAACARPFDDLLDPAHHMAKVPVAPMPAGRLRAELARHAGIFGSPA